MLRTLFISLSGNRKVLVLDEFHLMTAAVAAKTLEDDRGAAGGDDLRRARRRHPPRELVTDRVTMRAHRLRSGSCRARRVDPRRRGRRSLRGTRLPLPAAISIVLVSSPATASWRLGVRRGMTSRSTWTVRGRATVAAIVDEVLRLIDNAAEPLAKRRRTRRSSWGSDREPRRDGSGRKELEDRHGATTPPPHRRAALRARGRSPGTVSRSARRRRHTPAARRARSKVCSRSSSATRTRHCSCRRCCFSYPVDRPSRALRPPRGSGAPSWPTLIATTRRHHRCGSRSSRERVGPSRRCCALTNGTRSSPRRSRSTSLSNELGPDVTHVVDRNAQPAIDRARCPRVAAWSVRGRTPELLHAERRHERHRFETVDGPVDERTAERPHRPDCTRGARSFTIAQPWVGSSLEKREGGPLAERQLRQGGVTTPRVWPMSTAAVRMRPGRVCDPYHPARVASRQSGSLVMSRSRVRFPSRAPRVVCVG